MDAEEDRRARFAYALVRAMAARGATGRGLAKLMQIDPRKVTAWRTGAKMPDLDEIWELAAKLGVKESLFTDPPQVPAPVRYPIEDYLIGAVDLGVTRGLRSRLPGRGDPAGRGQPPRRPRPRVDP